MYTSKTMVSRDRYSYNCNKILNVNPNALPTSGLTLGQLRTRASDNVWNLRNKFVDQLTYRQCDFLVNIAMEISDFSETELRGIHEFRLEGGGNYRGGSSNDGYNSNTVSKVSVDFTKLGGNHGNEGATNDFVPSPDFNDGFGLYGAMSVVYRNGDIRGVFLRASTLPDKIEQHDVVAPGIYKFTVGTHPISGGYKALNLYTQSGSRSLPTIVDHVPPSGTASGINSHKGFLNERGSEACFTITSDDSDWDNYIGLFNTGESGKFYLYHFVDMPDV